MTIIRDILSLIKIFFCGIPEDPEEPEYMRDEAIYMKDIGD